MKADITRFKAMAVDGFVFRILDSNNKVDTERTSKLVSLAEGLPCTFHRAFDQTEGLYEALEDVIRCGVKTILTSDGQPNEVVGTEILAELVKRAQGRIAIMPGGGVRSSNIKALKDKTKAELYHSSAIVLGPDIAGSVEIRHLKELLQG